MQNYADTNLIPRKINNHSIELQDIDNNNGNQNEIQSESLPMVINQITPSQIQRIPKKTINEWGTFPGEVECPFCHKNIKTNVQTNCNIGSCCLCFWLSCIIWAIILLVRGKEIGCNDATHRCPNCKNVIGVYHSC